MMDKVLEAREFAVYWHGDQKYGELDYVVHLDEVAELLKSIGAPTWQICAAYLHDVLEDTRCPEELLREKFGEAVFHWVRAVSGKGATRRDKQASIVAQLTADRTGAARLKLGDRLANVRTCVEMHDEKRLKMYRKEVPDYAVLFEAAHPEWHQELNRLLQAK